MNELEFVTLHRRHLHQYPELSLHEFETTSYITSFRGFRRTLRPTT